MTRYEAIERALRQWAELEDCGCVTAECEGTCLPALSRAALALPEDSKTVNAELYGLAISMMDLFARNMIMGFAARDCLHYLPYSHYEEHMQSVLDAHKYLKLREASGEPMPYKVIRDGDKVRFTDAAPPKDGE